MLFNSKSIKDKKIKEIRLDRLNKQERCKGRNSSNKIMKKKNNIVWTKKGLLNCNGTFEIKRNRVGRPRRLKLNSQHLSSTVKRCPSSGKQDQEQVLFRCGLFKRSASSPINCPGISVAHQSYSNGNNYKRSNQDLLDISYNSDQFKVGSIRSNVGLLEQCMGKQLRFDQHHQKHHGYDFISSYSTSTSSSGVPASIDSLGTSVLSINSSIASSSTSSSPSSPSLLSNFSTADQDDWLFSSGLNGSASIAEKQQNEDEYLDAKCNADLCNRNSLFTTHNHSIKKSSNNSLLNKTKHHSKDQQENAALPFAQRSARQAVTLVNQQQTNTFKQSQKTVGYYASLHRGIIIQPPNQQKSFVYSDHTNSLQSSNHQTAQASNSVKNGSKNQAARRSRNGSGGKCRKKYGMENKQSWCLQCRWKKVSLMLKKRVFNSI